jgi:TolB-like protein/Tfp pilus assembly protein PilF
MARELRVGEWLVEPDLNRISSRGMVVSIEPKVIDVLLFLAEHPAEVLSRERIIQTVWPDTFVSEEVLSYSISELRKAFMDDARNPHIIQTIQRRGYRLIAPVVRLGPSPKHQPSIAVLAFSDVSPEKDQEYFCDGIADEVITSLTRLKGLRVVARTSSFSFKGKSEDVRTIGRRLGVQTVLEGSVRKSGNQLRISAQLINVEDGYRLWSKRYDRELKDVFAIQDEIAHQIVRALEVELSDTEKLRLDKIATENVEAYELYLRGRQFFYRSKRRSIECALETFSHATEKDPRYALAYAGTADCYSYLYMYFDNNASNLEMARKMSQAALEIDPELAEAHSACGLAFSLSKEYAQAEKEFKAAIQLNPRQFEAYYFYARTCFVQGKLEEAVELFEKAESVKPEDLQAVSLLAFTSRSLGQREKALTAYRRTLAKVERHLELNPDDSRALYLGATALSELGDREKCFQWARKACSLDPDDPYIIYGFACFYSRLGRTEDALEYFEQAVRAGFTQKEWIDNDSDFIPIRTHPRFQSVLEELNAKVRGSSPR